MKYCRSRCPRLLAAALGLVVAMLIQPGVRAQTQGPSQPDNGPAPDAVRIGVQKAAFPFAFRRGGTQPSYHGYAVDLCIEVVKRWRLRQGHTTTDAARDIRWVEVTSRTRLMKLLAGEIDLECGSTSNTAKRRALGISFSPTYFISDVGILMRPELEAHASSLVSLLEHLRSRSMAIVTTTGSTSMKHVRDLAHGADKGQRNGLVLKYGADHAKSFEMLTSDPPQAHAFVMDHVLLAAARATNPELAKARLVLANWSPAPRAQECYGVMTRSRNAAHLAAGGSDFSDVVADIVSDLRRSGESGSELLKIYARWFQQPLGPERLEPTSIQGVNLGMPPSPKLSRAFVSGAEDASCE